MKSRNKKRLLALVLCMVVAISNSSFIFASENGQTEYPQEAEVQTQNEAVADDMDVAAYAADEGQAVADEQPAAVEQVAAEPETTAETQEAQPVAEAPAAEQPTTEEPAAQASEAQEPAATPTEETAQTETVVEGAESQEEESEEQTPEENQEEEAYVQTLEYEDDNVKIHVSAKAEGIIPENASLKVVPLVKQDVTAGMTEEEVQSINEINAQYDVVEQKLNEKADEEEYDIGGFLAYDISFVDADGNKAEPNGDVKVTMEYKNAVLPETIEKENASDMDVTVMHLEEDEQGNVKQVVDMSQENNKIETIETTDTQEIKQAVFETNSFSPYAITWWYNITDVEGNPINKVMYSQYLDAVKGEVEENKDGNLPITDWKRSSKYVNADVDLTTEAQDVSASSVNQNWWKNVSGLELDLSEPEQVWDGSRNPTHNYTGYLANNKLSIYQRKLYDSATWKDYHQKGNANNECVYRFQGTFDIGSGDPNYYSYTIQQVTGNNKLYINDDMWVFIYPKDTTLNETNFMNYLAFWTGTRNQNNSVKYFNTRLGTAATRDGNANSNNNLTKLTDGWNMLSVTDNAGAIIQSVYNNGNHETEYVMDVFVGDNAEGGGTYRLTVNKQQTTKTPIEIKKISTSGGTLSGAEFAVEDDSHSVYYTATSGSDGIARFSLMNGTYTLKETKAPNGYVKRTDTWTITVNDGNYIIKGLEKGPDGKYTVSNDSEKEEALKGLTSSKTVAVKNYNERTYTITLGASTTGQSAGEAAKGASVILVLDESSSMEEGSKSIQDIKDAAISFVNTLQTASKESEVSVSWYRGSEGSDDDDYTVTDSGFKTIDTSYAEIVGAINSGATDKEQSGTPMGNALRKAQQRLSSAKYTNKYVILFTDGMPGYWNNNENKNCMVANNAYNAANEIKKTAVLYTVGYSLSGTLNWKAGHSDSSSKNHGKHSGTSASDFLKQYIATQGDQKYAYTTTDNEGLKKTFENLAGSIGSLYSIDPKQIVDVIDARFKLTQKQKNKFNANPDISFTENDDGTTTIIWTGSAAHIGNVNSTDADNQPWSATIDIVAKDDFIGGNMIPTNGSASGITVGENTKLFPQPSVNVKLLTPSIGDKEITYYKGDTIESSKFSGELLGTYKMTELDGNTAVTKGIPQLTTEQLAELKNGGTVEVPYSYTNSSSDIEGKFVYMYRNTKYEAEGTKVNSLEDHTATKVGQDVEEYKLTVTFVPKVVAERKDMLKDTAVLEPDANTSISGAVVTDASVTGTYKVHVLALWAIVKQSTSADSAGNHPMLSGAKFELLKGSDVCYIGESNNDGFVEWYKDGTKVSLSEMVKDTYTLRETSAPAGYAKSEVQWRIEIADTSVTIKDANGNKISAISLTNNTTGKTYDAYVYENTPVYALPSTGGTGIFLYMIGGMLLMGAAAWILYKNKRREVLKR